jgi:diguanylate cyclase (GGDEF)-like protein
MYAGKTWIGSLLRQPWWVAAAFVALLQALAQPLVERIDLAFYDHISQGLARTVLPPLPARSVIIAIDDRSLRELGHWPWRRNLQAALLRTLRSADVAAVGYDLLLIEPSAAAWPDDDRELAEAFAGYQHVVLPVSPTPRAADAGVEAMLPLSVFGQAVDALGHVDTELDIDGMNRRTYLQGGVGLQAWDALPLAVLRSASTALPAGSAARDDLLLAALPGPPRAPSNASNAVWWRTQEHLLPGQPSDIPVISAIDLLRDPRIAATLAGRVAWVGVTAEGINQSVPTPAAPRTLQKSAVGLNAEIFEALRTDRLVMPVGAVAAAWINLLPLLFTAVIGSLLPRSLHTKWGLVLVPMPLLVSALLLMGARVWLPCAAATIGWAMTYILWRSHELREARSLLDQARDQADATLCAITDGVVTVDAHKRVRYLNPSAERLSGRPLAVVRGKPLVQLFALPTHDSQTLAQAVNTCLQMGEVVEIAVPVTLTSPAGERLVQLIVSPIGQYDERHERATGESRYVDRRPLGAVLALTDVTDTTRAAERLQHQATHDSLTGLPNRTLLHDRLQHALAGAQRRQRPLALLFMDLDRFKRINDSLGHRQGDAVLQVIAQRLRIHCRANDTVARWGGDEFVLVMEDVPSHEAVATMAEKLINEVTREFDLDGVDVECGCSIGIAMAPHDATDVESLIAMADTAMYRGKANGGKRFEFYASEMPAWTREWLTLESRLRHSLTEESFELHYQPQINLRTGQTVGMEALLRWRQPDGTLWAPGRFLGVTEDSGLILPLGTWVIEQACRQQISWMRAGVAVVPVSVNVSARQCLDRTLTQVVANALESTGLPGHLLKIEVTESTAMSDLGHLQALLTELRQMGVGVALDDFGTGYSSLAHLKRFPIDQIKIDPSFVADITVDPNGAAIVRATIALAHGLGLPVVAEGVESQQQLDFLREHDCDIAQGYFYAPALQERDAADFLRHGPQQHVAVPEGAQMALNMNAALTI